MGVVPQHPWKYGKDSESSWSKPSLKDFTDKSWDELSASEKKSIAGHYAWAASMPPENFGDLKLPHHDPKTHNVVWSGVRAAMAALLGARGGVNVPSEDKKKIYNHLAKHYKEFGKEPPEFHEEFNSENIIETNDKVFKQEGTDTESVEFEVFESKYTLTKKGAVLKVSGVLMYPGTFTPMSGNTRSFSEEDLKRLVINSTPPIKLYLTHFDREHIGYATKIWYNEKKRTIEWNGYIFEKFDPIMRDGIYKTSPEISLDEYSIVGIAFVPNPAIPESMVNKLEVVAMSAPENTTQTTTSDISANTTTVITTTTDGLPTYIPTTSTPELPEVNVNVNIVPAPAQEEYSKAEESEELKEEVKDEAFSEEENKVDESPVEETVEVEKLSFSEFLGSKGLSEEDIALATEKAKAELVPDWFSDITEDEYKEFIEWRESRLSNLINDVKKLGFSNPEEIIKFARSEKEKIEILTKIKENLAFSEDSVVSTDVNISNDEVNSEVEKIKALCERFGIDYEVVKNRFER